MNQRASMKWWCGVIALVGGAGCASAGSGEDELVATAEENFDTSKFKGWNYVIREGIFRAGPAVLNVDGFMVETEVYGIGTDSCVWYAYKGPSTTAPWSGWNKIEGCAFDNGPAATMFHAAGLPGQKPTRRALVASVGRNAYITVTENPPSSFKPWELIPNSNVTTAAAITFVKPALFVVVWRREDRAYHWSRNDVSTGLDNSRWTAWQAIPYGVLGTSPTVTTDGTRIFVGGRGTDGRIWFNHTEDQGNTWYGWRPILAPSGRTFPFGTTSPPTMAIHNSVLVVAAQDANRVYFASADPITGETPEWTSSQPQAGQEVSGLGSGAVRGLGLGRYAVAARLWPDRNFKINYWDPF